MTRPPRRVGATPSPNIWHHPATYEIENRAADPHGRIEAAMASVSSWADARFLDIGCGSGFHLPRWAATAASVTGVEPHPDLAALARRRTRTLRNVAVEVGTAQQLPLADASVDIAHARWAYFFGPGCEPGLAELDRVMARAGTAFVIDNDATRSTFGAWFARGYPEIDPAEVERFFSTRGWTRIPVDMGWSFTSRADLEAVVRIEFNPAVAEAIIAEHRGTEVDYAVNLWWRNF